MKYLKNKTQLKISNTLFIVLTLFIVSIVSGCGGEIESSGGISESSHKVGFSGLDIWVGQGSTKNAFVGDEFKFDIHLHNIAAYDVTNGVVSIQRLDRGFFSLNEPSLRFPVDANSLQGISVTNSVGDQTEVRFIGLINRIKEGDKSYPAEYEVVVDYDITNQLLATVCLPGDGYNVYDGGCEPSQSPITFHGQGSPVGVRSVDIAPSGSTTPTMRFMFEVQNSGNGVAGDIRLQKASIGGSPLSCIFVETNTNRFTFDEEQSAEVLCEGEIISQSSYETTLNLEYFYHYTQTESGQMTVKPRIKNIGNS